MALSPRALLLDEPTAGLDPATGRRLLDHLDTWRRTHDAAVVLISHDMAHVSRRADRVLALNHGEAAFFGTPYQFFARPELLKRLGLEEPAVPRLMRMLRKRGIEVPYPLFEIHEAVAAVADLARQREKGRRPVSHADKRSSHRQRGYLHGESVVHRLDPRAKVSAAFVTLGAILGLQSWLGYIFMASVLLLTAALGRIPWRRLVGALQGVGLLLLFTVVVNGVFTPGEVLLRLGPVALTVQGLARGLALGCRLALIVGAMTLLTSTTKPLDLAHGLGWLFGPFRVFRLPVAELAMVTSIALRFVTLLSDEAKRIRIAQKARGIEIGDRPLSRATSLPSIVVPLFAGALRHADELGLALEARGYRPGARRGRLYPLRFGAREAICLTVAIGVAVVSWIWL